MSAFPKGEKAANSVPPTHTASLTELIWKSSTRSGGIVAKVLRNGCQTFPAMLEPAATVRQRSAALACCAARFALLVGGEWHGPRLVH